MWNVCSSDTAVSVQFRCGQGLHHALFHACSSGKDSWCIYDLRFTIKVENTSQQVATFRDVEEKKAALLVIMHVTLAVSQQPVLCRHCEKLKAPGEILKVHNDSAVYFHRELLPGWKGSAGRERYSCERFMSVWWQLVPWDIRNGSGAAICMQENYVVLHDGGADGKMRGERKPTYSCGRRGKSGKHALSKPGRSILLEQKSKRMKARLVILAVWKYEVIALKLYVSGFTENLDMRNGGGESPSLSWLTSSRPKHQTGQWCSPRWLEKAAARRAQKAD